MEGPGILGRRLPGRSRSRDADAGRPTKLTTEVRAKIVTLVQSGNFLDVAAEASRVDGSMLFRWLQKGDDHLDEQGRSVKARAPATTRYGRWVIS